MHRRGVMRLAAGASAPPAFSYGDIPDQLLRINSLEGSLAFSGAVLTGVTDVSGAGETVTVTGSPVYTAASANLNGAPSFTAPRILAPNINRASVRFVAHVVYVNTASSYLFDSPAGGVRLYALRTAAGFLQSSTGTFSISGGGSSGRKRVLAAMDGVTPSTWNGVSYGTHTLNGTSGTGMTISARLNDVEACAETAFWLACSSVPSAPLLAALEAKLLADFG